MRELLTCADWTDFSIAKPSIVYDSYNEY